MYFEQILEARALATVVPHALSAVDTGPWMVVQHVPSLGTGGTAATCQVFADTLTFTVDAAAPAGLDSIGNSTGEFVLAAGANNLMGELVDLINARSSWRAYLVGAIRADSSANLLIQASGSCFGANGLTLFGDTSATKDISLAVSGEKFVNNGRGGHETDAGDQCENSMMYAAVTVTSASLAVIRYYTGKQGTAEVQLGSDVDTVSATKKEQGEASLTETHINAARGERLVVRVLGVSNTAPSVPTILVSGKTAVLKNDRQVTAINY